MLKYGVTHRLSTVYHPQTSGQVEVSNSLKHILERTIGEHRASWSDKLDNVLWALCIAFKTPIRCTPYKLVYGKACQLPIELEHKAYWALKHYNYDLLKTRWTGPFTVTQVFPYGTVELSQTDGPKLHWIAPDYEASRARGNGYSLKDKNEAKTDKTEHGNGKSVKSQSQKVKVKVKVRIEAKDVCILNGPTRTQVNGPEEDNHVGNPKPTDWTRQIQGLWKGHGTISMAMIARLGDQDYLMAEIEDFDPLTQQTQDQEAPLHLFYINRARNQAGEASNVV
ncbi:reverse transcriptase domain-containing protein [Tanacetum coccineum]